MLETFLCAVWFLGSLMGGLLLLMHCRMSCLVQTTLAWQQCDQRLCLVPLARLWVKHMLAIGSDCSQADPRDCARVLVEVSSLGSRRGSCIASQHVSLARPGVSGEKKRRTRRKTTGGGLYQRLAANGEDFLANDRDQLWRRLFNLSRCPFRGWGVA